MSNPLWRQMYDTWERAVAPGLEEVAGSTGFRDLMASGFKANAEIGREIERLSRQWLHLFNLPAATDVRRLRKQVSGLERELLALRLELQRREGAASMSVDRRSDDAELLAVANGRNGHNGHKAA